MRSLLDWTLTAIREEPSDFSWMEEYRYDWVPMVQTALARMLKGQAMLVVTDPKRRWFEQYVLNAVNDTSKGRPFLPVHSLGALFRDIQSLESHEKMLLLEDMLEITYPQGYFFWYIGDGSHPYAKLVFRNDHNFQWLINETISGNFVLRESDPLLDIKLLQLYRLFDRSVEVALYGQVDVQ
jgi:hypothetical protein